MCIRDRFKGVKWQNAMRAIKIRTYKTSVYHPNCNPAERMLKEVGRLFRTYLSLIHIWREERATDNENQGN